MEGQGEHSVFFIGIGGIGMSALARHYHAAGWTVRGYDKTPTALTDELAAEGIGITFDDDTGTLDPAAELVVYTPAIPRGHAQLSFYRERHYKVRKRSEVLGEVTSSMKCLAVAGSHGKTSTSSLLNHIMQVAGMDCAAFLGGISLNYGTNYLPGRTWAVAEADEYDRSFHRLHPQGAIITSVDTDHLDVYGDIDAIREAFRQFAGHVRQTLVCHNSVPASVHNRRAEVITYSASESADYRAGAINVADGRFEYDVHMPDGTLAGLVLTGGGRHNVENSIGAIALARSAGVGEGPIREAVASYRGVRRRFEIHIHRSDLVYIDDYAHHPREIEVTLQTARELFPGRRLTVVFQPHLYSRTRDLAEGLAEALSLADETLLLDIYPAREEPIPGVDSGVIYSLLTNSGMLAPKSQVITQLNRLKPELLITMGAGDIDTLVQPIIKNFSRS